VSDFFSFFLFIVTAVPFVAGLRGWGYLPFGGSAGRWFARSLPVGRVTCFPSGQPSDSRCLVRCLLCRAWCSGLFWGSTYNFLALGSFMTLLPATLFVLFFFINLPFLNPLSGVISPTFYGTRVCRFPGLRAGQDGLVFHVMDGCDYIRRLDIHRHLRFGLFLTLLMGPCSIFAVTHGIGGSL